MECCVCNEQGESTSFQTNSSLQEHIAVTHCKAELYVCGGCSASFVSEYGLLKHLQNSCGEGNVTAMLDTQIVGKLELYDLMEKSINTSLSKKMEKAEVSLSTQLQAENTGLNNEKSDDTVSNNICPSTENNEVQGQDSLMEPELIRQPESLPQIEPESHVENVVSNDDNKDTNSCAESVPVNEKPADSSETLKNENSDDEVVVLEENIKHHGERKKKPNSPDVSKKDAVKGNAKRKRLKAALRKAARAQATSTEVQSTSAKVTNKADHRVFVSGINTEGITEDKIREILKEYFAIFGEVIGIKIIKNRLKKLTGSAHVKFKNLTDRSKALQKKINVKIGNSVCQLRKLSDKKDGMWHFSRNHKRLLMNRPITAPKPPQAFKQNRSFGQNMSFDQLRDQMSSGSRPLLPSPMQAENTPYSQRRRSTRDAPMYTPGMRTPGLMDHHNIYMGNHVRDQGMSSYLPENRIREPRMSEFHDRMGSYDQHFPYQSPVYPPSVNYTNRSMVHYESRNEQALSPPYLNYTNSSMAFHGYQDLPHSNMDFNHYQTPETWRRY
ncbi:RNA recognition motif domain-containing protein [Ditylenchus destructor]|nr:RNA recognition motif domain-containing protein [Ditylenchus destructor]